MTTDFSVLIRSDWNSLLVNILIFCNFKMWSYFGKMISSFLYIFCLSLLASSQASNSKLLLKVFINFKDSYLIFLSALKFQQRILKMLSEVEGASRASLFQIMSSRLPFRRISKTCTKLSFEILLQPFISFFEIAR